MMPLPVDRKNNRGDDAGTLAFRLLSSNDYNAPSTTEEPKLFPPIDGNNLVHDLFTAAKVDVETKSEDRGVGAERVPVCDRKTPKWPTFGRLRNHLVAQQKRMHTKYGALLSASSPNEKTGLATMQEQHQHCKRQYNQTRQYIAEGFREVNDISSLMDFERENQCGLNPEFHETREPSETSPSEKTSPTSKMSRDVSTTTLSRINQQRRQENGLPLDSEKYSAASASRVDAFCINPSHQQVVLEKSAVSTATYITDNHEQQQQRQKQQQLQQRQQSSSASPLPPRPPNMIPRGRSISNSMRNSSSTGVVRKSLISRQSSIGSSGASVQKHRHRLDSNCTNNSRHRRSAMQASFAFSVTSIQAILDPAAADADAPEKPFHHQRQQPLLMLTPSAVSSSGWIQQVPANESMTNSSWATLPLSSIQCCVLESDCSELKDDEFFCSLATDDEFAVDQEEDDEKDREDCRNKNLPFLRKTNCEGISDGSTTKDFKNGDGLLKERIWLSSSTTISAPPEWMLAWAEADHNHAALLKTVETVEVNVTPLVRVVDDDCNHDYFDRDENHSVQKSAPIETPITYLPFSSDTSLGWMAVSCEDDPLTMQRPLQQSDIAAVRIMANPSEKKEDEGNEYTVLVIRFSGQNVKLINLRNCYVGSAFVGPQQGQAVIIHDRQEHSVQCTLLPVSLPPAFFKCRSRQGHESKALELKSEQSFYKLAPAMLTPFAVPSLPQTRDVEPDGYFKERRISLLSSVSSLSDDNQEREKDIQPNSTWADRFAPHAQQEAATYLLFRLDSIIRIANNDELRS